MAGSAKPAAEDVFNNPRVKMLAYDHCSGNDRKYNEWYTATGGLHSCNNNFGIGDWFAKVVADSLTQDTLALIPCAIPGVDIDFFRKNIVSTRRNEFRIPPDNQWEGAYPWILERLKKAQEKGVIKGVLLHQGESDWTAEARSAWPGKVSGILKNLQTDLNFGDVPFLIGELRGDAQACCGAHNATVATTAKAIPNGHVIESDGLAVVGDAYHFDVAGMREFGKRFGAAYLKAIEGTTALVPQVPVGLPQGWRVRAGTKFRILEFDHPQDWIQLLDLQGRILAKGNGSHLPLQNTEKFGLLYFRSQVGSTRTQGVLFDLR
jgi:hypothetical protein